MCSTAFDLSKAFDCVPHATLLNKLLLFNFNPFIVNWVHNYLTNREQFLVVDGSHSQSLAFISGVLQGSVLGPLLFWHILIMFPVPFLMVRLSFMWITLLCLKLSKHHRT